MNHNIQDSYVYEMTDNEVAYLKEIINRIFKYDEQELYRVITYLDILEGEKE